MKFKQKKTKNLILVSLILFFTTINFYAEVRIDPKAGASDVSINSSGNTLFSYRSTNDKDKSKLYYTLMKYEDGGKTLELKETGLQQSIGDSAIAISDNNIIAEWHQDKGKRQYFYSKGGKLVDDKSYIVKWNLEKKMLTKTFYYNPAMIICSDNETVVFFAENYPLPCEVGTLIKKNYDNYDILWKERLEVVNEDIYHYGITSYPSEEQDEVDEFILIYTYGRSFYYKTGKLELNDLTFTWSEEKKIPITSYAHTQYDIVYIPQTNTNVLIFPDVDGSMKYKTSSWEDKVITEDTLSEYKEFISRDTGELIKGINSVRAVALPDGTGVLLNYRKRDVEGTYYSICDIDYSKNISVNL